MRLNWRYYGCGRLLFNFILNFLLLLLFSWWLRSIHFFLPANPISQSNLKSSTKVIELKMSSSCLILKLFGVITKIDSFVSIKVYIIRWWWRGYLLLLLLDLLGFVYELLVKIIYFYLFIPWLFQEVSLARWPHKKVHSVFWRYSCSFYLSFCYHRGWLFENLELGLPLQNSFDCAPPLAPPLPHQTMPRSHLRPPLSWCHYGAIGCLLLKVTLMIGYLA